MLADHPLLPLYFYVNKHLVKPYVTGWTDNVMNVAVQQGPAASAGPLSDRVTVPRRHDRPRS